MPPSSSPTDLERRGDELLARRDLLAARQAYQEALWLGAEPRRRLYERWTCHMLVGDYESAWNESDREMQTRGNLPREYGSPLWDGEPLEGRSVFVRFQHGLGDSLMYLRYVSLLHETCRHVAIEIQPELMQLVEGIGDVDRVLESFKGDPLPELRAEWGDVAEVECAELPYIFRTTPSIMPPPVEIAVSEERLACAKSYIETAAPLAQIRVGINCCASQWHAARSVPEWLLQELADIPGVALFCVQQEPPQDLVGVNFHPKHVKDIADTAALISNLDLVITPDTMVAHLAGSLGKSVWTMLLFDCDWRWMGTGETTSWYPSMRLFRQPKRGDWPSVTKAVKEELKSLLAGQRGGYLA